MAEPPLYFVCYSRPQRDFVAKVEAKLAARRPRGELDAWRDVRNLDVWEEFTEAVLAALERAAGAIVVISDAWYQSDYIQHPGPRAEDHYRMPGTRLLVPDLPARVQRSRPR